MPFVFAWQNRDERRPDRHPSARPRCRTLRGRRHPNRSSRQEVHLITAWDALRFDTPLKWGVTVGAPQRVHARASECRFRGLARESEQSRSESLPMRAWRADRWVWSKVNGTEWNQKHDQVGMVIEPGKRGL